MIASLVRRYGEANPEGMEQRRYFALAAARPDRESRPLRRLRLTQLLEIDVRSRSRVNASTLLARRRARGGL